jgi:hypothetical protein
MVQGALNQDFWEKPCSHTETSVVHMPPGHVHYAKAVCSGCNQFVRWLPSPDTVARKEQNAFRLAKLAMLPNLSSWAREFIRSLAKQKKFSPKQQAKLDELWGLHAKDLML